jgi:hypothetical protein
VPGEQRGVLPDPERDQRRRRYESEHGDREPPEECPFPAEPPPGPHREGVPGQHQQRRRVGQAGQRDRRPVPEPARPARLVEHQVEHQRRGRGEEEREGPRLGGLRGPAHDRQGGQHQPAAEPRARGEHAPAELGGKTHAEGDRDQRRNPQVDDRVAGELSPLVQEQLVRHVHGVGGPPGLQDQRRAQRGVGGALAGTGCRTAQTEPAGGERDRSRDQRRGPGPEQTSGPALPGRARTGEGPCRRVVVGGLSGHTRLRPECPNPGPDVPPCLSVPDWLPRVALQLRGRLLQGVGVVRLGTLPKSGPCWPRMPARERLCDMTAAVDRRFVARRHVDYGRVRSAMCPAS